MQQRQVWSLLLTFALLGSIGSALSGCNTAEGFGEDVESTGEAIQDEADEAR